MERVLLTTILIIRPPGSDHTRMSDPMIAHGSYSAQQHAMLRDDIQAYLQSCPHASPHQAYLAQLLGDLTGERAMLQLAGSGHIFDSTTHGRQSHPRDYFYGSFTPTGLVAQAIEIYNTVRDSTDALAVYEQQRGTQGKDRIADQEGRFQRSSMLDIARAIHHLRTAYHERFGATPQKSVDEHRYTYEVAYKDLQQVVRCIVPNMSIDDPLLGVALFCTGKLPPVSCYVTYIRARLVVLKDEDDRAYYRAALSHAHGTLKQRAVEMVAKKGSLSFTLLHAQRDTLHREVQRLRAEIAVYRDELGDMGNQHAYEFEERREFLCAQLERLVPQELVHRAELDALSELLGESVLKTQEDIEWWE